MHIRIDHVNVHDYVSSIRNGMLKLNMLRLRSREKGNEYTALSARGKGVERSR